MGDADVGAMDTGDAAASRALQMEGGSLPPRKRLLAGLKLNGLLATSPPPVVSPTVESVVRKGEEGCMGCNTVDSNSLRRIKRGGVSLRLCSACTLLYSKSMFCPHCLVMYHDATLLGVPSMWLVCTRCKRSVHPECEQKHSGSKPDAASYICLDCVKRPREANGVTGMRSKSGSGRPNETGSSPVDFVSAALKKPRMHRERRDHHGDGSRFERHRPSPDAAGVAKASSLGPPRKVVSSQAPPLGVAAGAGAAATATASPQEAAVAARNAATAAAKVAAAAKANAAVKAGAAVKAAAAAKAALEAAALACKAEAACRPEHRRKLGSSEARLGAPVRLQINVHSEPRRERSASMKHERDDGYGGRRPSVDDEELARQLHRVINSSPRISRSMTPMRRKNPSVKPGTPSSGVSNSSAETVRARPRKNPSPVEPEAPHEPEQQHHQFRHQQTRPRSITHKEFRRIESRVSRHEVKTADEGNGEGVCGLEPSSEQEAALSHMGEAQPAVKNEAMDGVMFTPAGVHDDSSILFDALVEVDGEGMHATGGGQASHDRRPDYLQEILEAAVLTDAGMFNDGTTHAVSDLDIVRPEPGTPEQGQEPLETSGLQSEAVTKDAEGESGDAMKEMAGEVTVAVAGDAVATEAGDAMAGEATDIMTGEAADSVAGEAAVTMAAEVADSKAGEAADTTTGEAAVTMAAEIADSMAGEAAVTTAAEVMPSGQNEGNGSVVVHDVEMQEVGSVDATQMGEEDGAMPEPLSTRGARVEESSGGEAATEEMRIEADAITPSPVGAGVPSEELKPDASESEARAASGVTATGSASQQSG